MAMDCPKCKSRHHVKDGIVRGKQRYRCKDCGYRYTVECKSDIKSQATRRLAFEMYLEGLGYRAIGRILKISYGTVYVWIKEWGGQVSLPRRESLADTATLGQMLHYVSSKKATTGYGLLLIDLKKHHSILSLDTVTRKQTRKQ
jgi:transposase-like protein